MPSRRRIGVNRESTSKTQQRDLKSKTFKHTRLGPSNLNQRRTEKGKRKSGERSRENGERKASSHTQARRSERGVNTMPTYAYASPLKIWSRLQASRSRFAIFGLPLSHNLCAPRPRSHQQKSKTQAVPYGTTDRSDLSRCRTVS